MKKKNCFIITISIIIITIILSFFSTKLPDKLSGVGFEIEGQHQQVLSQLQRDFDIPQQSLYIVFKNSSQQEIMDILQSVQQQTQVKKVISPIDYPQQKKMDYAYATLLYDLDEVGVSQEVIKINHLIANKHHIMLTGNAAANVAINKISQQDLEKAEMIGVPIALIILILAFGSIFSAIIPIIIGLLTIMSTFGILYLIHQNSTLSIYVLNIVPMIGLALSIDFCLLFISRYKKERQQLSDAQALQVTLKTSGEAILFSSLCIAIGLSALSLINVPLFRDLAIGSAIVIVCAVFYVLIFLPCLLFLLGNSINLGQLTFLKKSCSTSNIWYKLASRIMQHPIKIALITIILLVLSLFPIKNVVLTLPAEKSLPVSHQVRQAQDILEQHFNFDSDKQLYLLVNQKTFWEFNNHNLQKLKTLQQQLQKDSMIEDVSTVFTMLKVDSVEQLQLPQLQSQARQLFQMYTNNHHLLIPIKLSVASDSYEARTWIKNFSYQDITKSGAAQFKTEIFEEIQQKILPALLFIFGATFIILAIVFRSVILPIKAILMNILSLGATFGILIWLFQEGHLGLTATPLALVIPVIVFSLVFGLSMDYEVFLITSIKEYYYKGHTNKIATLKGLASTSKIITFAAMIMIVVTGAFAFTSIVPVKQLGIGIALAIFIDATLIRLLLVPSLMQLMGEWNWWYPFKRQNNR